MDVLIHARPGSVSGKIRENIDDPSNTECYWSVSGTPQETGRGDRVFFYDGEEFWGVASITRVEEGRIVFLPIRTPVGVRADIDDEPTRRGFSYYNGGDDA